jgi:anhydro-N-acetylmuramic acid kinase
MVYRVAGILNTNTEQLQAAFIEFTVSGRNWTYEIKAQAVYALSNEWKKRLTEAASLTAKDYVQLHSDYGKLMGQTIQQFIEEQSLQYKIQLIASPGLKLFNDAVNYLGDGAAVAAITGINTVSDFVNIDAALDGTKHVLKFEEVLPLQHEDDEAIVYNCFFAVLRWREENNFLAEQTGAMRNSIGGAVWIGQEW